jgi:hypothetical protein
VSLFCQLPFSQKSGAQTKCPATKRPATERPVAKNPWEKTSGGTKRLVEKTSGRTKRPGGQNVWRDKTSGDRTPGGTKRPWGQNVRREKENVRQGKKSSPLISGKKLVLTSGKNVRGRKNAWQGKKSPLSKLT